MFNKRKNIKVEDDVLKVHREILQDLLDYGFADIKVNNQVRRLKIEDMQFHKEKFIDFLNIPIRNKK